MVFRLVSKESSKVTKVKLARTIENTESVIYAIHKKLKNNPRKIASVKFSNDDHVDVLIINNFKVRNKKGVFIVDTSKEKIKQGRPLHKYREYFYSSDFKVVSEPNLLLSINERDIRAYPISTLLDIEYTKGSISKFVDSEMKKYKLLLNSTNATK